MGGAHDPEACRLRRAGVCTGGRDKGQSSCGPCRAVRRAEDAKQRARRRKAHACITCGESVAEGRRYCATHLAYFAAREAAKKAG